MMNWFSLIRPMLFALDPERAHGLTVTALKSGWLPQAPVDDPALTVTLAGLIFPNPVGLAAGFDKNAEVPDALLRLGFGFTEVGTVTPRPQAGNPKPRLFRLIDDRAIINRMGFNNEGLGNVCARLRARHGRFGIVGGNVGANKDSDDRLADYEVGIRSMLGLVDYITVNISSPNTPGLRALQSRAALEDLIARCAEARGDNKTPLFLKVAPDLTAADMDDITSVVLDGIVDALIVSNTTIERPADLKSRFASETGGLSGAPLFAPSTAILRQFAIRTQGRLPLIGVGGIASGQDAYAKIRAGASLVQLYSALIYQGPKLVQQIKTDLLNCLKQDGFTSITQAIGADAR